MAIVDNVGIALGGRKQRENRKAQFCKTDNYNFQVPEGDYE